LIRRIGVAFSGGGTVLLGVILMPLPGPGTLIVMVGLSVLAREFAWAERLLGRLRTGSSRLSRWALRQIDRSGDPGR
jgi:uncharacterized protein (TIGR02611 family)